jgi:hypothetical protein
MEAAWFSEKLVSYDKVLRNLRLSRRLCYKSRSSDIVTPSQYQKIRTLKESLLSWSLQMELYSDQNRRGYTDQENPQDTSVGDKKERINHE